MDLGHECRRPASKHCVLRVGGQRPRPPYRMIARPAIAATMMAGRVVTVWLADDREPAKTFMNAEE